MKKFIRVALAALLATTGAVAMAPTASADVDIYITPGYHNVNGREWRTACEPYSITHRCRTEIKATVVSYTAGKFVPTTGWAFNNLTYRPSPRHTWKTNPLGANGQVGPLTNFEWTATDGRKWRTECDTSTTGREGCRNYVQADVIAKTPRGYEWQRKTWQLNSMVRFGAVQPLPEEVTPDVVLEDLEPIAIDIADVPAQIGGMDAYPFEGMVLYTADPEGEAAVAVMAFGDLGFDVDWWKLGLENPTTVGAAVCGTDPEFMDYLCIFDSAKYGHTFVAGAGMLPETVRLVTTTLISAMP